MQYGSSIIPLPYILSNEHTHTHKQLKCDWLWFVFVCLFFFKCILDHIMLLCPSEKGPTLAATRPKKPQGKSRRTLRRQPDSLDSVDSSSTVSSISSSNPQPLPPSRRFRPRSKLPPSSQNAAEQDSDERPIFSSRATFSPEKSKLRDTKYSPQRPPEDQGHNRDPDLQAQQLVLYGANEFMV